MSNKYYSPLTDNVKENANYQGINYNDSIEDQKRTQYHGIDNLQNATINDDFVYISTNDAQHALIEKGAPLSEADHTALSGYFTSEETARNRINDDGTFDAYGYHRDVCVKPSKYASEHSINSGKVEDKGHLDRFYIDRDRIEEIYGTRDFNAAIGKCNALLDTTFDNAKRRILL